MSPARLDPEQVERLIESLDTASGQSEALNARMDAIIVDNKTRAKRFWSVLVAVLLLLIVVGVVVWRQSLILSHQHDINKTQKCLNQANDIRSDTAKAFYEREVKKLYSQADGFNKLLNASAAKNQTGALTGFKEFLEATKEAADSNAATLTKLGIKTILGKDSQGNVTVAYQDLPTAPSDTRC